MAKILLAEDEAVIRMLLTELLVEDGHQVIEASDGAEALALLVPDITMIVSDMMMPRMGGEEWVATARNRPGMEAVPVILMSALPLSPSARSLSTAFLQKPFRPVSLVAAVRRILAGDAGEAGGA
ncbi:CheY-like chemotaxis protein [Azospirillum agricola]|uniref:response regulator n=1 Tax=Azospirillum agricola TaxID=1720247 RepID=UPI001AE744C3|nr:response regulator [Azospirillum agricola]MBP2227943.1 CheY-like chemotaxis protein [Azospirillum agricola]